MEERIYPQYEVLAQLNFGSCASRFSSFIDRFGPRPIAGLLEYGVQKRNEGKVRVLL